MTRIMILGGRNDMLARARDLGVTTVHVHPVGACTLRTHRLAGQVLHADLDSPQLAAAAAELHRQEPFARVLSPTELGLLPAARLAERLGLAGNPVCTVELLRDKARMRARLAEAGTPPVAARPVPDLATLVGFMREVGGPVIVKPATGVGSQGVIRIDHPDQAARAWAGRIQPAQPWLAEELLTGMEVSVESVSRAGRHVVVAITEKTTGPNFVEIGHAIPAGLDQDTAVAAVAAVIAFLDTVGLVEGPAHTELMLTADGPRIIESHNRIGGDNIQELVQLATGIDLPRLAVSLPLGLEPLPAVPATVHGAAVRFVVPEPGVVAAVHGVAEAARLPDVWVDVSAAVGDTIAALRSSADRTAGKIIGWGADAGSAKAACEQALGMIKIDVVPDRATRTAPTDSGRRPPDVYRCTRTVAGMRAHSLRPAGGAAHPDAVSLAVGEPDFATPQVIVAAAVEALHAGRTRYADANGDPQLRELIRATVSAVAGTRYDTDQIVVTHGGSGALASAILATVGAGDPVVLPDPTYSLYADQVRLAGGRPRFVATGTDHRLDLDAMDAAMAGARLVVLCHPNNPTGAVYSRAELTELAELLDRHDCLLLADEAYADLVYQPGAFVSTLALPQLRDRLIYCQTLSKTYAMTGWRVGYLAAPAALAAAANAVSQRLHGPLNTIAQRAGVAALSAGPGLARPMLAAYRQRRAHVAGWLRQSTQVSGVLPAGGFYLFARYRPDLPTGEVAAALAAGGVLVRPGGEFGPHGERHLRISFATGLELLDEGLRRIETVLAGLPAVAG